MTPGRPSNFATPSPKARKVPHCRSCGSPMLGHRKGTCSPAKREGLETTPNRSAEDDELAQTLNQLDIYDSDSQSKKDRRRSLPVKRQPSLESLSDSSRELLTGLVIPLKQGSESTPIKMEATEYVIHPLKDSPSPVKSHPETKEIMPGTLIKLDEESNSEDEKAGGKSPETPTRVCTGDIKKRKSVRISLPGARRSLRLANAQAFNASDAGAILRANFIKTTSQPATLFTLATADCKRMEDAAAELGLQVHYFYRSVEEDPTRGHREPDVNLVIVGKNAQAIDDMLEAMERKGAEAPVGTTIPSYFIAQLTVAGLAVGAAAMWAGLAFA